MAHAGSWRGVGACLCALSLTACIPEGRAPRTTAIGEDSVAVHQLHNLEDPYADWFIAADRGVYTEAGRLRDIVGCEAGGYVCIVWPFVFSFPDNGRPPVEGWSAGGYQFSARQEVERSFCGRTRTVWMIDASEPSGLSTRTWYHPDFGIYAILVGQAEDGVLRTVERVYTTCERGLYAR